MYLGYSDLGSFEFNWLGGMSAVMYWSRQFTDEEAQRVSADPWALVRRRIPVELYGTGAAVDAVNRTNIIFVAAN